MISTRHDKQPYTAFFLVSPYYHNKIHNRLTILKQIYRITEDTYLMQKKKEEDVNSAHDIKTEVKIE